MRNDLKPTMSYLFKDERSKLEELATVNRISISRMIGKLIREYSNP